MTFEKTYELNNNNEIIIRLPERFKANRRVRVIIEGVEDDKEAKIESLKKAAKDPLFLSDIRDIQGDFQYSDKEAI